MQSARTRTSLGLSSLNPDIGLPPSPERILSQQGLGSSNLTELFRRQTPRQQTTLFSSPAVPDIVEEEEEFIETSTTRRSSLPDLVRSQSLDEELTRSGYTPLSKIVVIGQNNDSQVKYIKAKSQLGEPVYIAVDVDDAYVSHTNKDPRFKETRKQILVDEQEKEIAFTKLGLGVNGVALECKNGLCTILHDEGLNKPREQNFVLVYTKKAEETLTIASFPIVRMSDIRVNPELVCRNADETIRTMRNCALQKCLADIDCLKKKLDETCQLFQQTLTCKKNVINEFRRTMALLEDYYAKCCRCPEKNACKIKNILYNIEKRNAKFPYLLETCHEIAALNGIIDDVNCKLKEAKCKLDKKFKNLGCAYEYKEKKSHCHYKCAWEEHKGDESDIESD